MNRHTLVVLFFSMVIFHACTPDEPEVIETPIESLDKALTDALINSAPNDRVFYYVLPEEHEYKYLPNQEPTNPVTKEKVHLGKLLFFETGLAQHAKDPSSYETYSCATCHIPSQGFLPGRIQGVADGAHGFGFRGESRTMLGAYKETDLDAQGVRPLTVMNVGLQTNTLWSGIFGTTHANEGTEEYWEHNPLAEINHLGLSALEGQNIEGVQLHRMGVNDHVLDDYGYRELFDAAFPDIDVSERYTDKTISFAMSAYLRTLITNRAPFQDWLKGDRDAMTESQKKGAIHFFGKARCYQCHNGPSLSSATFHALGTADLYEIGGLNTGEEDTRNHGRAFFTGQEEDSYRFKVPQLYNLKSYATFFHGSSKNTLEEVIDYKIDATSENAGVHDSELSPLFEPLALTETERAELIDFLRNGLYDPDMDRYVPTSLPSGLCFPNNDPQSKIDLGCE